MRATVWVGIVLIVLGVAGLLYEGITYTKRKETVRLGPLTATAEQKETIPIPPWLGAAALVGGVILVVTSRRRRG